MSVYTFRFKAIEDITKVANQINKSFGWMQKNARLFEKATTPIPKVIDQMERETKQYDKALGHATRQQKQFNNIVGDSEEGMGGFFSSLQRITSFAIGGYAIGQIGSGVIGLSDKLKIANDTILQISGSQESLNRATAVAQNLSQKTGNGYEEMLHGLSKMLPLAKGNVAQAGNLVTLASALQGIDPSQGFEGALFALKELESGDTMSLRERFGIRVPTQSEAKAIAARDGRSVQEVMFAELNKYIDNTYGQGQKGAGVEFLLTLNADTILGQAKRTMNTLKGIIMPSVENINQPIVDIFKNINRFLVQNIEPIREIGKRALAVGGIFAAMKIGASLMTSLKLINIALRLKSILIWKNIKGLAVMSFGYLKFGVTALRSIGIATIGMFRYLASIRLATISTWRLAAVTAASNVAQSIGAWATSFMTFVKTIRLATIYQRILNITMMLNPIGAVIAGVVALGAVFYGTFKFIQNMFPDFYENMVGVFRSVWEWVDKYFITPIKSFFGWLADMSGMSISLDTGALPSEPGSGYENKDLSNYANSLAGLGKGSGGGIGLNKQLDKVVSGGGNVKNINIHIERMVEHFKIETTNISQSTELIKETIIKVLNDAVNDVNYAN